MEEEKECDMFDEEEGEEEEEEEEEMVEDKISGDKISDSLSSLHLALRSIEETIQMKKNEKTALQSIIKKQLENMSDLQVKCEEESIVLERLPKLRESAMERYEDAHLQLNNLQRKQFAINELLDHSLKLYDSTSVHIHSANELFLNQKSLGEQRSSIYKSDTKEVEAIGNAASLLLKANLDEKKRLLEKVRSNLSMVRREVMDEEINSYDVQIDSNCSKLEDLKKILSDMKKEWENAKQKSENIKLAIDEENNRFASSVEEWNIKWEKEDANLKEINNELEAKLFSITQLTNTGSNLSNKLAVEQRLLSSLQQELENNKLKVKTLTEELKLSKERKNELMEKNKIGENRKSLINDLQNKLLLEENKLKTLEKELERLNVEVNEAKERINEKETEYVNTLKENEEIEKKLVSLQEEISKINGIINEEKEKLMMEENEADVQLKMMMNQCDEASKEIKCKEEVLKQKSNKLEMLQNEIKNKETNIILGKEKIKNLEEDRQKSEFVKVELEICKEIYEKKTKELDELIEICNSGKELKKKVEKEKRELANLHESFKAKEEELLSTNKVDLDAKLKSLQILKEELSNEVDIQSDKSSKIDYEYYTAKNDLHQMKKDVINVNAISELATCENGMMTSFINWIKSNTGLTKEGLKKKHATETLTSSHHSSQQKTKPDVRSLFDIIADEPLQDDLVSGLDDSIVICDSKFGIEDTSHDEEDFLVRQVKRPKLSQKSFQLSSYPKIHSTQKEEEPIVISSTGSQN